MPLGQAIVGRAAAVTWIRRDVAAAYDGLAAKGRCENVGIAWLGKASEGFAWCAGQGIERVPLAFLILHVVEKGAQRRPGNFSRRVGYDLYDTVEIELCGDQCMAHFP